MANTEFDIFQEKKERWETKANELSSDPVKALQLKGYSFIYIANKAKATFHILHSGGGEKVFCKAENGWSKHKAKMRTENPPSNRNLCTICEIIAKRERII